MLPATLDSRTGRGLLDECVMFGEFGLFLECEFENVNECMTSK